MIGCDRAVDKDPLAGWVWQTEAGEGKAISFAVDKGMVVKGHVDVAVRDEKVRRCSVGGTEGRLL